MKSYIRKINYYETDQMAVVHHSNYVRYFEEARTSFLEQIGYPYFKLEEENIVSPVISVSCQYKNPVRYGDTIRIDVYLTSMNKVKCSFKYEIIKVLTNELCALGTSEHCFLTKEGKIVSVLKTNPVFYNRVLEELECE